MIISIVGTDKNIERSAGTESGIYECGHSTQSKVSKKRTLV